MHEFGIIQDVLVTLEKTVVLHGLKKVNKVTIQVGRLRQVVPENLQFAFSVLSENTIFSDAKLIIIEVPITVLCKACNKKTEVNDMIFVCPNCGSTDLDILNGKEIVLESIEGEGKR